MPAVIHEPGLVAGREGHLELAIVVDVDEEQPRPITDQIGTSCKRCRDAAIGADELDHLDRPLIAPLHREHVFGPGHLRRVEPPRGHDPGGHGDRAGSEQRGR